MANVLNQIGSYTFLNFLGTVGVTKKQAEVLTRPGVDQQALRVHGSRCKPFDIVGVIDVANKAAAKTALDNYAALIGAAPQTFVFRDIAFSPLKVDVIDVDEASPMQTAAGIVGGINVASGAVGVVLRVRFTLIITSVA